MSDDKYKRFFIEMDANSKVVEAMPDWMKGSPVNLRTSRVCSKDNPMPPGVTETWEHPESDQFGSSGHGDNGAIGFFQCRICQHDFMGISMEMPTDTKVQ